jgi:acetolactate synthase-1/2/3 large subunit
LLTSEISIDAGDFIKQALREEQPPENRGIEQIVNTLHSAERPLVLTGPALNKTRAGSILSELQKNLAVPVISMESPRGLKDPALGNFGEILGEADVVLFLGKAVDFTVNFGQPPAFHPSCRFLVIDPEPALLDQAKRALTNKLVISHLADADLAANAILTHPTKNSDKHADWSSKVAHACASRFCLPGTENLSTAIHPAALCQSVQRALDLCVDPVLISDGGEFGQWVQAMISAERRIINGPAGAIGGGICYAIAAKMSHPESSVFVLMGDGTAGFHLSEFETAVRQGTAFVAIIGNDSRWNAEYQIQLREYGEHRLSGCELGNTRYDQVVSALGGYGEFVDKLDQLDAALSRAIDSQLPACINVQIEGLPAPTVS